MCCHNRNRNHNRNSITRQIITAGITHLAERREIRNVAPTAPRTMAPMAMAPTAEPLPPAYSPVDPHTTFPGVRHVTDEKKAPLVDRTVPPISTQPAFGPSPLQQQQQQQQQYTYKFTPLADQLLTHQPRSREEAKQIIHLLKDELRAMKHARKEGGKGCRSGLSCGERKALKGLARGREEELRGLIRMREEVI